MQASTGNQEGWTIENANGSTVFETVRSNGTTTFGMRINDVDDMDVVPSGYDHIAINFYDNWHVQTSESNPNVGASIRLTRNQAIILCNAVMNQFKVVE